MSEQPFRLKVITPEITAEIERIGSWLKDQLDSVGVPTEQTALAVRQFATQALAAHRYGLESNSPETLARRIRGLMIAKRNEEAEKN